jgi:hypothetical protein
MTDCDGIRLVYAGICPDRLVTLGFMTGHSASADGGAAAREHDRRTAEQVAAPTVTDAVGAAYGALDWVAKATRNWRAMLGRARSASTPEEAHKFALRADRIGLDVAKGIAEAQARTRDAARLTESPPDELPG